MRDLFAAAIVVAAIAIEIGSTIVSWPAAATGPSGPNLLPDDILARGVLRIGVDHAPAPPLPTDYQTRREDGIEAILNADIGKELAIVVQMMTVDPGDRHRALDSGDVDVLIVSRGGLRHEPADGSIVIDAGYGTSLQAIMRSDTRIRSWADLAGRTVCVTEEKQSARALTTSLGANAAAFP